MFKANHIDKAKVWALFAGILIGAACSVRFTDDVHYSCKSDVDCGGEGFVCTAKTGGAGTCCKSSGAEVCNDNKDNDCNGKIDAQDVWPDESCNGIDDDCDGQIDEGFNLAVDANNCGACANKCASNRFCQTSTCQLRLELDCTDSIDNDVNQLTDCADPSCTDAPCASGCRCRALKKTEVNCNDGIDNDSDTKSDCADTDCAGAGCGDGGCVCEQTRRKETSCNDSTDNDSDGNNDCSDSDCIGQLCQGSGTFRCAQSACSCNDGGVNNETGATLCRDRIDNDCDGLLDCQEANCMGLSCTLDGGAGCLCMGGKRAETACNDRRDNDDDGSTDCADNLDCPMGTGCTFLNMAGSVVSGACSAQKLCQ